MQGNQINVNINDSTIIQKIVSGTLSDLQSGQTLTVMGAPDASGNIVANSIIIQSTGETVLPWPFAHADPSRNRNTDTNHYSSIFSIC